MSKIKRYLTGPRFWVALILLGAGVSFGIGMYVMRYAKALSYLSSDPKACVNCHIMRPQYEAWQKASHHQVAGCIDCHLPHGLISKYLAKAQNGYHHSKAFTLQNFHEPIALTPGNRKILQTSCLHCHRDMAHEMLSVSKNGNKDVDCIHCHSAVGHGEPVGLGGPDHNY